MIIQSSTLELHDKLKLHFRNIQHSIPMFRRSLRLPPSGKESFFLWGARQTGKSTLLRESYPDCRWLDLLKSDEYVYYSARPERLRQEIEADGPEPDKQIVIDEVQRIPELLNEVHWLIENYRLNFALCGSSARKVRHGGANLLGGRAFRYFLRGVTAAELGGDFDLDRLLNHGYLPRTYETDEPDRMLESYIGDYLQEEIAAEGLVRRLPTFASFLDIASLSDGESVNFTNISRECGVSAPTVKGYFEILDDTLLGTWLPAYRQRNKRRVAKAPKFYFADVGVVNRLARRGTVIAGSEQYGKAFENWVHHELSAYITYQNVNAKLNYWRLASGVEVDFLVDNLSLAVEAKSSENISSQHLRGLRSIAVEYPEIDQRVIVCRERRARITDDGILILPAERFVERLWSGDLIK